MSLNAAPFPSGQLRWQPLISVDKAEGLACQLLAGELPPRWQHVQAVAERARSFRLAYDREETRLLVASAYLHDIGYAPAVKNTGFHPLDGARHLRHLGFDERIVGLVAHHSCACIEATFHHLEGHLLREFPRDDRLPHDALLYCDLTTGPTGEQLSIDERLIDIRARYGPNHLVSRFIDRAEPEMRAAVLRAEELLSSTLILV